jgi:CubicO group peptidase (beta-lactamase class C family)
MDAELQAAVREAGVTGASFTYWDGNILHTAVAGLRNSVTGDPVTPDTLMHVGSITKVMNTVLLMQLVDEGRVALDDPVSKYLPELRLRDTKALQQITCAMLVNHTSGIEGEWLPEYGPDQERIVDTIERCSDLRQLHAPGEAASYCNVATVIAGYLTQKLRGTSWYTLVKSHIYEPLELRHSLVDPLETPRFRVSVGDVTDPLTGMLSQTPRPFLAPSFAPAGATQMMSATDLVMFARALLNGGVGANGARILSAEAAARMSRPTVRFFQPADWHIGLGWMILPGGVLHHAGGGRGVISLLYAHPGSGRAVALLTNCDRGLVLRPRVLDPILESWTGSKANAPARQSTVPDPAPYAGVYQNNVFRYEVQVHDGGLLLRAGTAAEKMGQLFDAAPAPAVALHPLGNHLFEPGSMPAGLSSSAAELYHLRFVEPDAHGRMKFLSFGTRVLARVE